MASKFIPLLFMFILSPLAEAKIEVFAFMPLGYIEFDETSGGANYEHRSGFAVGHLGLGIGSRLYAELGDFDLGAVGEGAWVGDTVDRTQVGVANDSSYRFESFRYIVGASFAARISVFRILAEYYPIITNTVSYSDEKAQNPFRANDRLKGQGYGIGFGYQTGVFSNSYIFRTIEYKDVELNGTQTTLPSTTYTALKFIEVAVRVGATF